jgi:RNA polymerase sigma-70 factor (ECF subfamily)
VKVYDRAMEASERAVLESEVAALCDRGEIDRAATLTIEGYGPELLGLILALVNDEALGADVFSAVCERIWQGLPGFERRASLRTWTYRLARNEVVNFQRQEIRRRARQLHDSAVIAGVEQRVRTTTINYRRTQTKSRFAMLRATLPLEDQTLLILRIDREMEWNDIVTVMRDSAAADAETIKREAARLRKRFQSVKERLRELATDEGLLESD